MTYQNTDVVLGIDVGTSGVRVVAATACGNLLAEAQTALPDRLENSTLHEQDPNDWWTAVCSTVGRIRKDLSKVASVDSVRGMAVDSTSGSLVLADSAGQPVRMAILYDDPRGASIAQELNRECAGGQFNASYSLIKAAWVRQEEPQVWARARHVLHPADWLAGKLTGQFGMSDDSNALKLGYDFDTEGWNDAVSRIGVLPEMLPQVVKPSTQVGTVCAQASEETGLRQGTPVFAGATDGMAGLIASGACEPGHANTTLGTTMVWKVLSPNKPRASEGIYCHRHPAGLWAPGAASNTGPGSLRTGPSGETPADLDRQAAEFLPSPSLCYLLRSKGERFPFLDGNAETFFEGTAAQPSEAYAAQLQSLALVERWGYERLEECGAAAGEDVFTTGSAAASLTLMQLRANVLKRQVHRCHYPASAFGAAILAASTSLYGADLPAAIQGMARVQARCEPDALLGDLYDGIYSSFRAACARRGYE